MLLDKVIRIALHLNESFKSNIVENLNKVFLNSSLTYIKEKIIQFKYKDDTDIEYTYRDLFNSNELTLEDCDDPKIRRRLLNVTYKKKSFNIIRYINNHFKHLFNIDYSNIKDSDFEVVELENARKKKYKDKLLFWMGFSTKIYEKDNKDYSYVLRAVTYGNDILFVVNDRTYNKWYDVNDKYTGHTEITSDFGEYSSDGREKFIKDAFISIPVVEIYTGNDIKEKTGITSILKLLQYERLTEVYALNIDSANSQEYKDKIQTRYDYKKFLKEVEEMRANNIRRYNNIKYKNFANNEITDAKLFIDDAFNYYVDTAIPNYTTLENKLLENPKENLLTNMKYKYNNKYLTDFVETLEQFINNVIKEILELKEIIADIDFKGNEKELSSKLIMYKNKVSTIKSILFGLYTSAEYSEMYDDLNIPNCIKNIQNLFTKYKLDKDFKDIRINKGYSINADLYKLNNY